MIRVLVANALSHTLYRVRTEIGKQNSRTIPGLFFIFFKDFISFQFNIK